MAFRSGKSSLIRGLIARKPVHETWAVLVNEFGQVGIDQAMFEPQDMWWVKGSRWLSVPPTGLRAAGTSVNLL
ncbi:hypothetical protein DSL92_04385 [Billgrantia gudaonensis]|uniref:CobW/HypB/UreG nucleotide-binding domain-containing protein n=1 Tax=Billgrantia gudaonensis TaxID=376427 RepID=A0A3S0NX48_9GAMM|nr:hypothetical protein DSL92_04385 [Halomonas gudaonensis]